MARVVSQSNTEWVKKGDTVNGKVVTKGYLAQKGKPAKKVTARVQMEQQTGGVSKGDSQLYAKGRRKTEMMGVASAKSKNPPKNPSKNPPKSPPKSPPANPPKGATTPPPKGGKDYATRVSEQRTAANKAGSSTYSKNKAPVARSGATGTPLLAGSEIQRGLTTRSGKTSLAGLPRGYKGKPQTFGTKFRVGTKASFLGVVKEWDGRKWVPLKKK